MVKEKGKEKEKVNKKQSKHNEGTEIYFGTVTNSGKGYIHECINGKDFTDKLAEYLWLSFDRTRLNNNWNDEIPQRQIKYINHSKHILQEVLTNKK